jgi:hypothetical protein
MSHDAPIGPRDNQFWRRLDVVIFGIIGAASAIWWVATHL